MKRMALLPLLLLTSPAMATMKPTELKCEYLVNPIGIDAERPRLSWALESARRAERQTAYQVQVASSEGALAGDRPELWDSGKVESAETLQVEYAGTPLVSGQRCLWRVRSWDRDGRPSAWSRAATWEMGILRPEDWHGTWIARTTSTEYAPAPLLRRAFRLAGEVRRARAYVCGLGYQELRVNGRKVSDHVMDPGYTRYDRRALYVTYDVTEALRPGQNALGVMLGTGWYNVHTRAVWNFHGAQWRAAPKLLLELRVEYADGRTETIGSDDAWRTSTGPIVYDSIYGGETYDARLEKPGWDAPDYDDSAWEPAVRAEAPGGAVSAQAMPPIRVLHTLRPTRLTEPRPGVWVFDMGRNFAGRARLRARGPAGARVTMRYGERLAADGTLDVSRIAAHLEQTDPPQRFQTDEYVLKGGATETWQSRFTYHGFQYVQVTGYPGTPTVESLEGLEQHTDVPAAGEFHCSNPLLNRIWDNGRWSYWSNLQSIPTDCPHREKNGWTGDAHLAAEQAIYSFLPAAAYTKWVQDLADEQRESGELPGIVPTGGWGYEWGNGPAWDSAFLLIPRYMRLYYADTRILARHYEGMKRYVDYLTRRADEGIVSIGLGDWCPYETDTPVAVTSTGYYYVDARIVAEAAALLGKGEDARRYGALAESVRQAFMRRFYDPKTGQVANGSQTALSCALYQGLAGPQERPRIEANLAAAVERRGGHIDAGILGAKYLLHALTDSGRADLAYRVAAQRDLPSWGHWIEQGATTLWEDWGGGASLNHIMFGDICAWFYSALAGIRPDPSAPGFARIVLKPHVVGDLTSVRAVHHSLRGRIESTWEAREGTFEWRLHLPANTESTVWVPCAVGARVTEGGRPAGESDGVRFLREESGYRVFAVGSGEYRFGSRLP